MVVTVIQNFAKKDCIHYEERDVTSCCGRTHKTGGCSLNWKGNTSLKLCSTKMKWCKYEPKGEQ